MWGGREKCKVYEFYWSCYQFKIGCYKFKLFFVSLMVTTREDPVVITHTHTYTHKNLPKNKSKHTDIKIYQNTHTKTAG